MPKKTPLNELLQMNRLTPGRRKRSLGRASTSAKDIPEAAALLPIFAEAMRLQDEATRVALAWDANKDDRAIHGDGAVELHAQVSKVVTALCDALSGFQNFPSPRVVALATKVLKEFYPNGSAGQSTLPYVEQCHKNEWFVSQIGLPQYEEHVTVLGIGTHISTLAELLPQFAEKLSLPAVVTFADAQAAETKAEAAFLGAYCGILGLFSSDEEPSITHRSTLVEPILDQLAEQSALRAVRRAKKAAETGAAVTDAGDLGRDEEGLAESVALDQELAASPPPGSSAPEAAPAPAPSLGSPAVEPAPAAAPGEPAPPAAQAQAVTIAT